MGEHVNSLDVGECMEAYVRFNVLHVGARAGSILQVRALERVCGCKEHVRFDVSNVCANEHFMFNVLNVCADVRSTSGPVPSREGESARHVPSPGSAR